MGPLTDSLAAYINELNYSSLSQRVVNKAKMCILDFCGVALADCFLKSNEILIKMIEEFGGKPECTVIGHNGLKVPAHYATLANCAMAQTPELDDGHRFSGLHPGPVVIGTALAIGEQQQCSGKHLIAATVAGYEVMIRMGMTTHPMQCLRGHHNTVTCGVLGAAATAAKLLELDRKAVMNALAIAGPLGLLGPEGFLYIGSMLKGIPAGVAAHNGVISAMLAARGFTGPPEILEGHKGYLQALTGEVDQHLVAKAAEGYQRDPEILRVYHKFYASCRHTHPAIDAVLAITENNRIETEKIDSVKVVTYPIAAELVYNPKGYPLVAKFSIPYCVALALLQRRVGLMDFTNERVKDLSIQEISNKVHVISDSTVDFPSKRTTTVEIKMKDGRKYSHTLDYPHGCPEWPADWQDIVAKFNGLMDGIIDKRRSKKIEDIVSHIDRVKEVTELAETLGESV